MLESESEVFEYLKRMKTFQNNADQEQIISALIAL